MTIHDISLVVIVRGNVFPVGLLGGVCEKLSDFGHSVKNDHLHVSPVALLAAIKIMY
jgi:hypothetical protein